VKSARKHQRRKTILPDMYHLTVLKTVAAIVAENGS